MQKGKSGFTGFLIKQLLPNSTQSNVHVCLHRIRFGKKDTSFVRSVMIAEGWGKGGTFDDLRM